MALPGRRILVLYGSETGNSQDKAEEVDRLCQRLRFHTDLKVMDETKLNDLLDGYDLVCFVVSTTGQGEFPANARAFWKSLRRAKLPPNCLAPVRFTTFGLGDSSYQKFNWSARLLRSRLLRLGASEAFERGEADERHDDGVDSIYQPWVQKLREYLLATYPLPDSVEPIPDSEPLSARYLLRIVPDDMRVHREQEEPAAGEQAFAGGSDNGDEEEERRFLANRDKNAALSHVDRPRSSKEQVDADRELAKMVLHDGDTPRYNGTPIEVNGIDLRQDFYDKDNILKDAPEKYLLRPSPQHAATTPPSPPPPFPPPVLLPVPYCIDAKVAGNTRVTPADHWQDVRLLQLDVHFPVVDGHTNEPLPGDTIVLYAKNYPEDVQRLIDLMGWGDVADANIAFQGNAPAGLFLREGATLRELLTHNLDITAIPSRTFLEKLSYYTTNPDQTEKLLELIQPAYAQEFYDFTSRPRRTILEVLAEFRSAVVPYDIIPDMFPVIRGREFSIANGGVHWHKRLLGQPCPPRTMPPGKGPDVEAPDTALYRFDLLVALVEYKTIIRKPRQGLCSRYIKHLPVGTPLRIDYRRSNPPPCGATGALRPLIAIATGTGIAPIRSLLHERATHPAAAESLLFFGCRNQHADFHFHEEWAETPKLTVYPAFSRDPVPHDEAKRRLALDSKVGNNKDTDVRAAAGLPPLDAVATGMLAPNYDQGKTYVQHVIRRNAARVCELLRKNAVICLCGNSGRMPKSVRAALLDAAVMGGFCADTKEAEKLLFEGQGDDGIVYWEETW
ncbi:NADPH-dependent fmn FAD containing oxidoreductase [Niveomyces insectorum RCEF 264]|uniref:NADPH-dependent fmn FAD containing oxidoreductase n=1 Tax=Niveomyces insectorum RCEF 264 TaxID=1081102 RepID=A0A167VE80_9HYPO|nr:NADPH-dependent fmn FAD containing oxidoreductase [Niveomyces insectorum RCEF 264]